ncbi:outer membrane homotrimeric porin [Maridesulfovibrio bastinii]|uniref:outer membrane homotrimeric porin n=1 Tax=Maridesulfovibrio bastinii TaxID=47157 RepID=UPI000407EFB4|nr:outer membrane homotrimeric porin [Maridesulfovibrio bastinii]
MKRLVVLAITAAFVLGMIGSAFAGVDLEATGKFQFQADFTQNPNFKDADQNSDDHDSLNFWFRARTQFRMIANENLWAVLYTEYKARIGSEGADTLGGGGTDSRTLKVKQAYLGFRYPGTEVYTQAGIFDLNMPQAAGNNNMIIGDYHTGAIAVEAPITDAVKLTVGFARPFDSNSSDTKENLTSSTNMDDEMDLFFATVPVTIDGFKATPWFAYAMIGQDTFDDTRTSAKKGVSSLAGMTGPDATYFTDDVTAWWLGGAFEVTMFDPIIFKADVFYGSVDADQSQNDREGWGFDGSVAYTGLDFVKPKFVFTYTSGEDDDKDNGSERLPVLHSDFGFGSYYQVGSAFTGDTDGLQGDQNGYWTIGLCFDDISFIEKLTHSVNFLYYQGTNDADLIKKNPGGLTNIDSDGSFLTDEDHLFEVDINTNYQIYDELAAIVEFSYINADFDQDTWKNYGATPRNGDSDAYKFAVGLIYNF